MNSVMIITRRNVNIVFVLKIGIYYLWKSCYAIIWLFPRWYSQFVSVSFKRSLDVFKTFWIIILLEIFNIINRLCSYSVEWGKVIFKYSYLPTVKNAGKNTE